MPLTAGYSVTWRKEAGKSAIRLMLLLRYLQASWLFRAVPYRFFQLNSDYFSEEKGIFSKLDLDEYIPLRWRLRQTVYDPQRLPETFPVFAKPEWGQNAIGIVRLDNGDEYTRFSARARRSSIPYLVQAAATGHEEYEIYYLRSPEDPEECAALSVTQVINTGTATYPINSIHNPATSYLDLTDSLSGTERTSLWHMLKSIGRFRMARLCLKANSRRDLLRGRFQVVEINLFLPMPLVLLAANVEAERKMTHIRELMGIVARLVATLPKRRREKAIFFRKVLAHYRNRAWIH